MKRLLIPLIGLVAVACSNTSSDNGPTPSTTTTTGTSKPATTSGTTAEKGSGGATFASVASVASSNCMPCHGAQRHKGGLDLTSYAGIMKGGDDGQVVKPGDPDNSLIVKLVKGDSKNPDIKQMPPGKQLSAPDIQTISDWIKAGAKES